MHPHTTAAPSKPVLLGLVGAVLGVHLWLLAGELPDSTAAGDMTPGLTSPNATPNDHPDTSEQPLVTHRPQPASPRTTPVTVSSVRWIVPAPPPAAPPASASLPEPRGSASPPVPTSARTTAPTAPLPDEIAVFTPEPLSDEAAPPVPAPVTAEAPAAPEPARSEPHTPPLEAAAPMTDEPPAPQQEAILIAAGPVSQLPGPAAAAARASAPVAVTVPGSTVLRYDIQGKAKGLNYSAQAELRWDTDGTRYNATMEIKAFLVGSRVQTSRGRITAQGLAPERFGDKRRNTEKAAHFDAAGQRIRFSNNAPDAPLLPGAQDRLSVFLQLAALLQTRPQTDTQGLTLPVAGTGSAEEWHFRVGDLQDLSLPAGTVSARKLTREPRHEHDSRVEIWLAPELQYLPVRIRVTEPDGAFADQLLRQLPPLVR